MNSNDVFFLNFLVNIAPKAAEVAKKMEELLYQDPGSAIVKARVFAESILNEVFKQEKIEAPYLSTLHDKISYLAREGYIKRDVQQAFDIIRLSGNKAAHDAEFNDISEAVKLHKEMYKVGAWFYELYSSDPNQLPSYEFPKPNPKEDIKEIVQKQILEILGTDKFKTVLKETNADVNVIAPEQSKINEEEEFENDKPNSNIIITVLEEGESYLLRELDRLKDSSQEAVENANQFSSFKDYLHVKRKIQIDLESILEHNKNRPGGNLILLCGSVGDGKSHLLAYLRVKRPELLNDYTIYNDATESFSPNKNAMETLEKILRSFSDQRIHTSDEKIILAINMGVLHNFINVKHQEYTYDNLKLFVEKSDLFSQKITTFFSEGMFDLLNFGDYQPYEITENGSKSYFYSSLLNRIFSPVDNNPFYLALLEDEKRNVHTMVHENFKFFMNEFVQNQVVQIIIQTIVKKKLVISARAFLNFVADILIPDEIKKFQLMSEFEILESSLPNLLFNRKERSTILFAISQLDPIHRRTIFIDQLAIELNTVSEWNHIVNSYIKDDISKGWLSHFISNNNLTEHSFTIFIESFIRMTFLTNKQFADNIDETDYSQFIKSIFYFNTGNKQQIKRFYDEIKTAIYKWRGSPKKDYIYLDNPSEKYRLSQKLNLRPTVEHLKENSADVLDSFKAAIVIGYRDKHSKDSIFLDIDFPLYSLLTKVQHGYRPNKKDKEDAIKFVEFIDKLMNFGEKRDNILVHFSKENSFYVIKRDDFGAFVFERE